MSDRMISEHFSFTPAIKNHIQKFLDEIHEYLPGNSECKVWVDHEPHKQFHAIFQARAWKRDLMAKAIDSDLYLAIQKAADTFLKNVVTLKKKSQDKKRRTAKTQKRKVTRRGNGR